MKEVMASGKPWEVAAGGEKVDVPPERARVIEERMIGAYFGLVNEVISSGITNIADLEMGVQISLVVRPPFAFMNELGLETALDKVRAYREVQPNFPIGEGRCCTARSKSLTSLCRLQSHPAQYVSGIPSAAILLSISHPIRCSTRCLANVRARISGPMIAL